MTGPDRPGRYVVVGATPWAEEAYRHRLCTQPGAWSYIGDRSELTAEHLTALGPDLVFFLHWRWKVPADITDRLECVNFHMTDLPYGRGGSPLQNLILRGHRSTVLCALRMTGEMDAGPVYDREPLDLSGSAHEIYRRAADLSADMVLRIVGTRPEPEPQQGEAVVFTRRTPDQSRLPDGAEPERLYDLVRMLDAPGYPHAFLEAAGYRVELTDANLDGDAVTARARITPAPATGGTP